MGRGVRYVSAEGRSEDDFGYPFTKEEGEIVYDARTKGGPWATMSESSFELFGAGQLGLGSGQKYRRNAQGHLIKVEV